MSSASIQRCQLKAATTAARIFAADFLQMQQIDPVSSTADWSVFCSPNSRSHRLQLVDQQGLDHDRALGYEPRCKTRLGNQRAEKIEVGIRRQQDVDAAILCEPLARLLEKLCDVAVVRPRMPSAVCDIARLAGKRGRARNDHVELLAGSNGGEQVRADGVDPVLEPVRSRVLGRRQHRVGVYVDRRNARGPGPNCGESEDPRSGADIGHSLDGFGFLVPRSSGLRTLGTVWNSSLFAGRAPENARLLTSFIGGAIDPAADTMSSEELAPAVHREIAPILAIRQTPIFSHATIYARALPQCNVGHSQRLAEIEKLRQATGPGLWLTGNYLRGPSIGACVEQSLAVARDVLSHLAR